MYWKEAHKYVSWLAFWRHWTHVPVFMVGVTMIFSNFDQRAHICGLWSCCDNGPCLCLLLFEDKLRSTICLGGASALVCHLLLLCKSLWDLQINVWACRVHICDCISVKIYRHRLRFSCLSPWPTTLQCLARSQRALSRDTRSTKSKAKLLCIKEAWWCCVTLHSPYSRRCPPLKLEDNLSPILSLER